MSTYDTWHRPDEEQDVLLLQLDALNPRLPDLRVASTEREIIEQLIEHEDLLGLMKSIGIQGFFPTEVLVCVSEAEELVVIEGNRRLASLKLYSSPELAPEKSLKQVRSYVADYGANVPKQVEVVIAPDRASTVPLLMNKHTRLGVKGWEPLQQAQYVKNLLSAGIDLEVLPGLTGISRSDILKNLRTNSLYEMAKRIPFDKETASVVGDPRRFPASTLERVSGSPEFRSFLGIDFDATGGVVGKVNARQFQRAFAAIVTDISAKKINTRTLNDATGIRKYIKTLEAVKPDVTKVGSFTSDNFLRKPFKTAEDQPKAPIKEKRHHVQKGLIAKSFRCNLRLQRVKEILEELQRIDASKNSNAVGVTLRIFIELPISHYLESTGRMKLLVEKLDKNHRHAKPEDWTPSLRQMLVYLLANDEVLKQSIPRQALKALNRAVADDEHQLSLDGMDQFVHNPYICPSEPQLRKLWNTFESLTEYLMREHPPIEGGSAE